MPDQDRSRRLQENYEPLPDPVHLTHNTTDPSQNSKTDVDYEPHPERSMPLSKEREAIKRAITNLYCGSAHEGKQRPDSEACKFVLSRAAILSERECVR